MEVKKFIESKGCILKSDTYVSNKSNLDIVCKCGKIFSQSLSNFKRAKKYNCPTCSYNTLSYNDVKKDIEKHGCKLLSYEYINNGVPLKIQCQCGNIFSVIYRDIKSKSRYRCPKCNNRPNLEYGEVVEFIESKGCKLLSSSYVNNRIPLLIECKCGNIFERKFNTFKDGSSYYCKTCTKTISKGERSIEQYLNSLSIRYEKQYKIVSCRFKRPLPFDFYLPDHNTLIEFDGRQHYEIVQAFGGLEGFIDTKIRDTIKNIYCKDNNIKLIRIPHWESNNIKNTLDRLIPR